MNDLDHFSKIFLNKKQNALNKLKFCKEIKERKGVKVYD